MKLKDARGKEVKIGSTIAYTVRNGAGVAIKFAKVTFIDLCPDYPTCSADSVKARNLKTKKEVTLTSLRNIVVVGR